MAKVVFKRQSSIDKANNKFGHLLQISPDKDDAHGDANVSQSLTQADRKRNSASMQTNVSGMSKRQSYLYYKVHYYLNSTIRTASVHTYSRKEFSNLTKFMLNKSPKVDVAVKQSTRQQKAANQAAYADQSVQNEQTQQEVLNNSCRVNQSKTNENLNSVFNEMNKLNERTTSQVHHMLALTKLAQHEYAEAIAHLKLATEMGYTKASFNLGLCFQNGLGVVKDQKLAFFYFKKAADGNHCQSAYNCAIYYLKADNIYMGLKYLRLAAKENHWQAKKQLAALLIRQQWHFDEAFGLLSSLTNNLDAESEFYFGLCFENGYGTEIMYEKALDYYQLSYAHGCACALQKIENLQSKMKPKKKPSCLTDQSKARQKLGHFTQSMSQFINMTDDVGGPDNASFVNRFQQSKVHATLKASRSSSQLGNLLFDRTNANAKQSILAF